jgi:Cu(I)/Ag(I) efflux system membrane protein CusA/SilA
MVETFVNFRPREHWPKRGLTFEDASLQTRRVLAALEERGYVARTPSADDRDALVNDVTMGALMQFDETLRALALQRHREFERELGPELTRFALAESVRHIKEGGRWRPGAEEAAVVDGLTAELAPTFGAALAAAPAPPDVTKLTRTVADRLADRGALSGGAADALALPDGPLGRVVNVLGDALGRDRPTFAGVVLDAVISHRTARWSEFVRTQLNGELFDRGVEAYTWAALEELAKSAKGRELLAGAPHGANFGRFVNEAVRAARGKDHDPGALAPFVALRQELEKPFARTLLLWRRTPGPKGDLLQEMDGVLQVPGWSNIWTQPIANRIDMLATGVRTQIGVKVFGPDLAAIDRVCKQVERALKPIDGARDVLAEPIMGKGYLEITIDRAKAARYGLRVGDIQDTIEVTLGGRVITQTVEGRDRFPVRVRYARDFREDEQAVRRLLVGRALGMGAAADTGGAGRADDRHAVAPARTGGSGPLQVPLGDVADIRIVEGPAMIKSENGRLRNYVTLNVRDRDVVGFVDEAMRVVSAKVPLPEGVHLEWSGEFEHQVRAAKTLRFLLPVVLVLIFTILYLTYHDLYDAALMMLAVPEALAGGVFFQVLFPKILHGWSAPPVDFSVAVWVGYIAAFGMATETGVIMLVYLREAIDKRGGLEKIGSLEELRQAVIEGAVHRLRPKLLTEGVAIVALAPMLFATGVGGEIISVLALPVMGGLLIADEVVDVFLPVRFYWIRRGRWLKLQEEKRAAAPKPEAANETALAGIGNPPRAAVVR